ncbi:MAG: hypothetical protein D6701_12135 [Gemmatimonadetes bacterium]|nr:MAG: hypothetical protein D6701_12135 [Gemmatimonadota bacterium]
MRTELISEVMDDAGLGIKVRVSGPAPRDALQEIGEAWANAARGRAERVWVWLYGSDMDADGPAIAVTYMERDGQPVSDFVDPSTLLLYYMHHPARPTPGGRRTA